MMHERQFGAATITCELYDGVSDYRAARKSTASASEPGGDDGAQGESVEEQEANLESFADWLEADSTDEEIDPNADD